MSKSKAFTLIEMLITIVIVGILSAFVIVQVNDSINAGKDVKRKADIELLANAVVSYSAEHYSSKPVTDIDGCTIGGDCGSTIEDSLRSYLPTLPNDPDSGTYYIYQSDGNDCTISASLSSGDIYQYSCVNDVMTIGTSTSGICGSSHNQNYYSAPTENFCAGGFIPTPSVSATGWTWECPGEYLGADVQCLANKNIDGACGTSANDNFYLSSEITNPCTSGTVTNLVGSGSATGYFTWTCPGAYSGTTASCTANLKVDGVCGINGGYYETLPAAGVRCANGTTPSNTNAWSWYCIGLNEGGNSATCSVTQKQSCSYYGGTTTTCGGISCCKISGSSCPAGYNYLSWTTTTPYSWCSLDADDCKDPSGATAPFTRIGLNNCYYSTSHSWSNATNSGEWISCQWNDEAGTWVTYWSTITEIGCY